MHQEPSKLLQDHLPLCLVVLAHTPTRLACLSATRVRRSQTLGLAAIVQQIANASLDTQVLTGGLVSPAIVGHISLRQGRTLAGRVLQASTWTLLQV